MKALPRSKNIFEIDKIMEISSPNPPIKSPFFRRWAAELAHHCPNVPLILVGTKTDLREDSRTVETLKAARQTPVTTNQV